MINRKGFTVIELLIVVLIIAILAAIAIPNFISMQDRAKEAKVKGAAHTVQRAAENWAVREEGVYSVLKEIQSLLPGGELLENAFTGKNTEPQFGVAATMPGQVGIQAVSHERELLETLLVGKDNLGNDISVYVDTLGNEQLCAGYLVTGYGASYNGIVVELGSDQ